jgi:hypothetical protein
VSIWRFFSYGQEAKKLLEPSHHSRKSSFVGIAAIAKNLGLVVVRIVIVRANDRFRQDIRCASGVQLVLFSRSPRSHVAFFNRIT